MRLGPGEEGKGGQRVAELPGREVAGLWGWLSS